MTGVQTCALPIFAKLLENNDFEGVLKDLNLDEVRAKELLKSFGISKESVEIWGTGRVRREFLHSDDLARASIFVMQNVDFKDLARDGIHSQNTHINIGTGVDYTIKEVAFMIKEIIGFKGELKFNANKPDSSMDRLMDVSKINSLGWRATINLEQGIKMMYEWYLSNRGGGL